MVFRFKRLMTVRQIKGQGHRYHRDQVNTMNSKQNMIANHLAENVEIENLIQ